MFEPGKETAVKLSLLTEFVVGLVLIGRGMLRASGGFRFTIGRLMIAVMIVAFGLASPLLGLFSVVMAVLAPVLLTILVLLYRPAVASDNQLHDARS
jgi:hypothetical protein